MTAIFHPDMEDVLLRDFLGTEKGFFVEVGANAPFVLSQSYPLEQQGWQGLLIEPHPYYADLLEKNRSSKVYRVACGSPSSHGSTATLHLMGGHSTLVKNKVTESSPYEGAAEVSIVTLNSILEMEGVQKIRFISIDVEGYELEVLLGFDIKRFKPDLLLLEDHVLHLRTHRYLLAESYKLIRRTGLNSWHIPKEAEFPLSLTASPYSENFILGPLGGLLNITEASALWKDVPGFDI